VLISSDVIGGSGVGIQESLTLSFDRLVTDITFNGTTFHSCFDRSSNTSC